MTVGLSFISLGFWCVAASRLTGKHAANHLLCGYRYPLTQLVVKLVEDLHWSTFSAPGSQSCTRPGAARTLRGGGPRESAERFRAERDPPPGPLHRDDHHHLPGAAVGCGDFRGFGSAIWEASWGSKSYFTQVIV